ncbi:MAG: orotidine-5'-phosphate decarboxylase [Proteobacteria bacterium]|nr:orotidine-5'-phosphate decarboxylase [Pseudomonadota bacterium]
MFFGDQLAEAVKTAGAPLAMGLDPHLDRLPSVLKRRFEHEKGIAFFEAAADAVLEFNHLAVEAAADKVAAIKPQFAFYEQLGSMGIAALEATIDLLKDAGILIIGDAKRGDISSTARAYAQAIVANNGPMGCDSITLNPWMGLDTLEPFLPYCLNEGKGIWVLCRTTNPKSDFFQKHGEPQAVDRLAVELERLGQATKGDSGFSSVGAVVGAMAFEEAQHLRSLMPSSWFLVPGVGAQGGGARQACAGSRADGLGSLVVSSRSLLFPKGESSVYERDPKRFIAKQVEQLHQQLRLTVY